MIVSELRRGPIGLIVVSWVVWLFWVMRLIVEWLRIAVVICGRFRVYDAGRVKIRIRWVIMAIDGAVDGTALTDAGLGADRRWWSAVQWVHVV